MATEAHHGSSSANIPVWHGTWSLPSWNPCIPPGTVTCSSKDPMTSHRQSFCLSHAQQTRRKTRKDACQTGKTRPRTCANAVGQRAGRQGQPGPLYRWVPVGLEVSLAKAGCREVGSLTLFWELRKYSIFVSFTSSCLCSTMNSTTTRL